MTNESFGLLLYKSRSIIVTDISQWVMAVLQRRKQDCNDLTASPISSLLTNQWGLSYSLALILVRTPLWRFDIEKERLNNINCWELKWSSVLSFKGVLQGFFICVWLALKGATPCISLVFTSYLVNVQICFSTFFDFFSPKKFLWLYQFLLFNQWPIFLWERKLTSTSNRQHLPGHFFISAAFPPKVQHIFS